MAAAEAGEPLSAAIVRRAAEALGLGIAGAANLLDPDVVVLGGGVPEAGEAWWGPLRDSFARHAMQPIAEHTRLEQAELGYRAGVLGAAALGVQAAERGCP
jgi:glucokinase